MVIPIGGCPLRKRLTAVGNSLALIIERPILDLLGIGPETDLEVTTDGKGLTMRPIRDSRTGISGRDSNNGGEDMDEKWVHLGTTARHLSLPLETLKEELEAISARALNEDWEFVRKAAGWPDSTCPDRWRENKSALSDGRLGLDLLAPWRPGIFVGAMLDPTDHKCGVSTPGSGADFSLILSVSYTRKNGAEELAPYFKDNKDYRTQREFTDLVDRLADDSGDFHFYDHVDSVSRPNLWHPIHLRRPLEAVFAGAKSPEERYARWMAAAKDALTVLFEGGELTQMRDRALARVGK
jgi:hypothetical protein